MQGLKSYVCGGCLCRFGAMSALHECPHCRQLIDYHPDDYHKQVRCPRKRCGGVFGYKLYTVGPRIEAALREEVRTAQEARHKQRAAAARHVARQPKLSEKQQQKNAERNFAIGLIDECPRCGFDCGGGKGGTGAEYTNRQRQEHLRQCTDEAVHAKWRRKQQRDPERAQQAERAAAAAADDEVSNAAAWRLLGGTAESAWLLTDTQLAKQCEERGIATEGSGREAQLASLAAAMREAEGGGGAPRLMSAESAPANLHAMSAEQLRGVCAAHGMAAPEGAGVDELVALLEGRSEAHLALEGGGLEPPEADAKRLTHREGEEGAEGEEDEEGDGEWKPAEGDDDDDDEGDEEEEDVDKEVV